jgi:hypothetical protein
MSFDLSRIRFDHRRDFLGVIMQQGRVQLDADWNEWVAEFARRLQAGTWDTLNGSVVPRTTPDGFLIEAAGGGLSIGPGRIYVDGLLAENHGDTPAAWDPHLAEVTGTAALDYTNQPYYPDAPDLPGGGTHLVYIDVWQREITAIEDQDLVEPAVGVDTTGRLQTVWQVKVLEDVGDIDCTTPDDDIPGWREATAPSAARLSTTTGTPDVDPDPCRVPPGAGYLGLENQLYRVEIHRAGALGSATFKWSRDNASVASRVTHINGARDRITVEQLGRDEVLRFHDGDWVEVTDDHLSLHNRPGELRRIRLGGGVDETAQTLHFESALPAGLFPTGGDDATIAGRNTRVRRWDQSMPVRDEDGVEVPQSGDGDILVPAAGTRLFLEHGVLVEFSLDPAGGVFHSGDHWVFAARSATGAIEELQQAPPLAIHHHYARLALVDFPDGETDCRMLWPPIAEGQGCDCTRCVNAEGHNDGSATLQQAIDSLQATGGTICLGVGSYQLRQPLNVKGARSLRIRGQGWATLLIGEAPHSLIEIDGAAGVTIEHLTLIGSDDSADSTPMLLARNLYDMQLRHCNLVGLAVREGTSVGLGLAGNVLGATIEQCAIVAEQGIARVAHDDADHLLSGELRIQRNLFFCSQRAVNLDATSLHYGFTRIDDNLMLGIEQAAIVALGATLPGSPLVISDNAIYTAGDGIRAGVDGLTIERNAITGIGDASGDGIRIDEGLDPVAVDRLCIQDNRLLGLNGNGIAIRHRVEEVLVVDNQFNALGLGALIMAEGGAAGQFRFAGNQCRDLGLAADNPSLGFSALQLLQVSHAEIVDNSIGQVARNATSTPQVNLLRILAADQVRLAGNRLFAIGPDRGAGEVNAIRLPPPFEHAAIDENHVQRGGDGDQNAALLSWRAIDMAPPQLKVTTHFANALLLGSAENTFLLTATRLLARSARDGNLAIGANRLQASHTISTLVRCERVDDCLFHANQCQVDGDAREQPTVALLVARTINASNNRLVSPGDLHTLHVLPGIKRAIVMGNTSTGPIDLLGAAPVPSDLGLTNILGN